MRLRSPLDAALASQGHVRVLRALDALPEGLAVSVRDLARRSGLRHPRTSQILADLRVQGLAIAQRAGRADLYQLNREHVLFPTLNRLFAEERASEDELVEFLRARLVTAARYIREAYIFGSVARGQTQAASDVDLAVIADRPDASVVERTLDSLASEVKRRYGNELSVHLSREPLEKRRRARDASRFLWNTIAREGIRILPIERRARA